MDQDVLQEVFRREIRDRKIPLSLGKTCPVKCSFCYEKDISYRRTYPAPLTTEEQWRWMLSEIGKYPSRADEAWIIGGNEYMEWTDLFLHPRTMDWLEEFLETTDKKVMFFTVGYADARRVNRLAEKYAGRIDFELSVISLDEPVRRRLMPNAPTVRQVLEVLDGPAVTSANFYSFGPDTLSQDARTISRINPRVDLWMGCLTPLKHIDRDTADLMRFGKKHLPDEARKIHYAGLPNATMIHTESDITAFLNRNKILTTFDACNLEKRDTVVMAGNVYRILRLLRPGKARYLYVPNTTLGGDSNCTTLLTFADIAARLSGETRVWIPRVVMEHSSGEERDISGVGFEAFKSRFPRTRFKVLYKINSARSNKKLYEKGYVRNYVEDYLQNPLSKKFESVALPN